jgi:GATA-binding protein, other eukaryote
MKKTVIKRRKRVPAAGGVSAGRMTDQAAAEALVAVGRLGVGGVIGGEESDGEAEQPKKKRARKGRSERDKRKDRDEDDVVMDGTEEEGGVRERPQPNRRRSRESNGSTTWDLASMQQPHPQAGAENGHAHGTNGSPPLDRQQRAPSVSRLQSGEYAHLQRSSSHGQFMGSPHPHGGFDLPPLNAALGGGAGAYGGYGGSIMGGSREYVSGAPSSYIRSGSSAPSRTHSPLGPAGAAGGAGTGYILPPPHSMSTHSLHQYYGHTTGMSPLHPHSPPPHQAHESVNGTGLSPSSGVPTLNELGRHYDELLEQRKKFEEMVEKTERMMAGVKRGMDEMRGVHQSSSQSQPQSQPQSQSGPALPLVRDSERPRSRASVWPLESTSRE